MKYLVLLASLFLVACASVPPGDPSPDPTPVLGTTYPAMDDGAGNFVCTARSVPQAPIRSGNTWTCYDPVAFENYCLGGGGRYYSTAKCAEAGHDGP